MPLLINKDGQQLGPYSLDEARALVLSGKLEADDWAWPDGSTQWVQLKDVPGFTPPLSPMPTTAPANPLGEEELWRGHPSQILNLQTYIMWTGVLLIALAFGLYLDETQWWAIAIFGAFVVLALFQCTWAFFRVEAIEYVVTTQRVRKIHGILSKDIQEIELFRVKDTMANQSLFLRLFGLGTITIISGDERHPQLVLSAIPNAIQLRERLRQEVMTLRQRFGVRELDVM